MVKKLIGIMLLTSFLSLSLHAMEEANQPYFNLMTLPHDVRKNYEDYRNSQLVKAYTEGAKAGHFNNNMNGYTFSEHDEIDDLSEMLQSAYRQGRFLPLSPQALESESANPSCFNPMTLPLALRLNYRFTRNKRLAEAYTEGTKASYPENVSPALIFSEHEKETIYDILCNAYIKGCEDAQSEQDTLSALVMLNLSDPKQ